MRQPGRCGGVGDVEQRHLEPGDQALAVPVLPDADQLPVRQRIQVGRVAGQFELTDFARIGGVVQIQHVQRVEHPERHDVGDRPGEAHRVDLLATAQPARRAGHLEGVGVQHIDAGGRDTLARDRCRNDAQVPVVVRQGVGAEQPTRHASRAEVARRAGGCDVEAVDLGALR